MTKQVSHRDLNVGAIPSESILDNLPDGLYLTDLDRRIVFWNRAAERITGWSRKDVVGKCCRDNVLCHVDKDGHLLCGEEYCPLHRSIVTGQPSRTPLLIFAKRRDRRRIPVEVSVSPLHDHEGTVIGGIEVFRDLSPTFEDLNRARAIQREAVGMELGPDSRIEIGVRYTPHDQVGGDFYRIEALDEDRYAFFVADIVGHGVSAALYAMELRALWNEARERVSTPPAFLDWLSHCVEKFTSVGMGYFATALHIVYQAGTGALVCATAGHPAPLIVRATGTVEPMNATGPGLGLLSDPLYQPACACLDPGDSLLIYTDGAFEIEGRDGAPLSEDQFWEFVRKAGVDRGRAGLADLEVSLLRHSNQLALPDDLTLISLHRNK